MRFIGLLMIAHENDVLADVLALHENLVDVFYVLDGTVPNVESRAICEASPKCGGYLADAELPRPPYPEKPVCGYRKAIHDMAVVDHGPDNWFVVLHGDEVWTRHPRSLAGTAVAYQFLLPFYFPRAGEPWDYTVSPLEQLRWWLGPGYPEWRMFRGTAGAGYRENQAYDTMPQGLVGPAVNVDAPIRHYLYRSPEAQRARALQHLASGFDPANYQHILDGDAVYWTDDMISRHQQNEHFRELHCDTPAKAAAA